VQHTGSSRERLTARGQRPSLARARTPRGAAIFSAFCVRRAPDDGQAAHGCPPGTTAEKTNGIDGLETTKGSDAGNCIARLLPGTVPETVTIVGAPATAGGAATAAIMM